VNEVFTPTPRELDAWRRAAAEREGRPAALAQAALAWAASVGIA